MWTWKSSVGCQKGRISGTEKRLFCCVTEPPTDPRMKYPLNILHYSEHFCSVPPIMSEKQICSLAYNLVIPDICLSSKHMYVTRPLV